MKAILIIMNIMWCLSRRYLNADRFNNKTTIVKYKINYIVAGTLRVYGVLLQSI